MVSTKYLIIGNSAGGIGAAEAIRQVDKAGHITIVSDEPYPAYSRPLISKYLARECSLEKMLFRPADFYDQNSIIPLLGRKVKRLAPDSHAAELDGGEEIVWEKLLLASGGVPIVPKMEGMNKKGVFTFTTLDDAKVIDRFLENADSVVVIGGGLIGVSAAEALRKRGLEVTVVEMKERVLNTILDDTASLIAEQTLKQAGVRAVTGHTVGRISGKGRVREVALDNGERIPCDLVVVAIGVSPRAELASGTGIKMNRGIVVDRYIATSQPDVYSCGDVAEAYDIVYETNRLTPIWPAAYIGGRVAGYNMAGVKTEYAGGTAMNSLNYFGLDVTSAGMVTPPEGNKYEVITKQQNGVYKKVVLKDDLVTGMVFVGDIEKSGIVFNLMRDRVNVHDFKESLLTDDFGLVSFPQKLRQEWLEMGGLELSAFVPAAEEAEEVIASE